MVIDNERNFVSFLSLPISKNLEILKKFVFGWIFNYTLLFSHRMHKKRCNLPQQKSCKKKKENNKNHVKRIMTKLPDDKI